jgi:hypothetical protein
MKWKVLNHKACQAVNRENHSPGASQIRPKNQGQHFRGIEFFVILQLKVNQSK